MKTNGAAHPVCETGTGEKLFQKTHHNTNKNKTLVQLCRSCEIPIHTDSASGYCRKCQGYIVTRHLNRMIRQALRWVDHD